MDLDTIGSPDPETINNCPRCGIIISYEKGNKYVTESGYTYCSKCGPKEDNIVLGD